MYIVDNIQLAPPCWVMPQQYEEFAGATTNLRSDRKIFFIKPVSSASDWRSRVINLEKPEDIEYTRRSFVNIYYLWLCMCVGIYIHMHVCLCVCLCVYATCIQLCLCDGE